MSISLMNRLNQTQSAVFKFWDAVFPKDLFSDYLNNLKSGKRTVWAIYLIFERQLR